jgi:glutaconate CoA-transferase subunit B
VSAEQVERATGFAFDRPATVPATAALDSETLQLLRGEVARAVSETYPAFAAKTWPQAVG